MVHFFSGIPFGQTTHMPSKENHMAKGMVYPFRILQSVGDKKGCTTIR